MVVLQHGACMCFGGTFDPAYVMSVFALPSELQPTTNKRNAALIQRYMHESLGVPPSRGLLRFVPTAEENLAHNGRTTAGEIDESAKDPAGESSQDTIASRRPKATKKLSVKVGQPSVSGPSPQISCGIVLTMRGVASILALLVIRNVEGPSQKRADSAGERWRRSAAGPAAANHPAGAGGEGEWHGNPREEGQAEQELHSHDICQVGQEAGQPVPKGRLTSNTRDMSGTGSRQGELDRRGGHLSYLAWSWQGEERSAMDSVAQLDFSRQSLSFLVMGWEGEEAWSVYGVLGGQRVFCINGGEVSSSPARAYLTAGSNSPRQGRKRSENRHSETEGGRTEVGEPYPTQA